MDTVNAPLLKPAPAAATLNTLTSSTTTMLAVSAPSINYGGARTFAVDQSIDWLPTNSGGEAEFGATIEQTLTGYYNPLNTLTSEDGTMYITNAGYHSILRRTSSGTQTVFAGGNSTGWGYVDGTGTAARFRHPSFMALDGAGNIYVADQQNHWNCNLK